MLTIRRNNGFSIIALGFWLLAVLIFCNINGITFLLTGSLGLISPILILLCFLMFPFLDIRKSDFSKSSWFFIMTIAGLFILGILPAIYFMNSSNFQFSFLLRAFREAITSIIIFTIFYSVFKRQTFEDQMKYLKIIFVLFVLTTVFGALEPVLGFRDLYTFERATSRRMGLFGNPNETGMQACFTLVMTLGLYMMNRLRLILAIPIILVAIFTAISTFSKTAMLNVSLILILYTIYAVVYGPFKMKKFVRKRNLALFATVLSIFFLFILPNLKSYYDELKGAQKLRIENFQAIFLEGELTEKTTSERSGVFSESFNYLKKNPVFGYGTGTFTNGGMFETNPRIGAHNTFLKIYLESGLLALLLFLAFIYHTFLDISLLRKNSGLFFLSSVTLIAFLVYCLTSHSALNEKLSVALIGILLAIHRTVKVKKPQI